MSSIMAMPVTTPVKSLLSAGGIDDMTNESPLPTPPQAEHDLRRNGRSNARLSVQSSSRNSNVDDQQRSSSPSSRAALAMGNRDALRLSGLNHSPAASLGISMGSTHHYQRNALGLQMGILTNSTQQPSSGHTSPGESSYKPSRPGALISASQRSASYEASVAAKGLIEDPLARMNSRSSHSSLAMSAARASHQEHNKENTAELARSSIGLNRKSSVARRISSKRSPSPTATAIAESEPIYEESIHRRSSGENEKQYPTARAHSKEALKKSNEEGGTRRRQMLDEECHSPRQQEYKDEIGLHGVSHFVTPGLNGAARALRAGQPPSKHVLAPWSVGRSIKRIDRSTASTKPPQRVVASQADVDEGDDDVPEEVEQGNDHIDMNSPRWNSSEFHSQANERDEMMRKESRNASQSPRELQKNGSDGIHRSPQVSIPLGADEDEEEDDFLHDPHHPRGIVSARSDPYSMSVRKVSPAVQLREQEPDVRKSAMHDILSAKVPLALNKRVMEGGPSMPVAASREVSTTPNVDSRADFMAQVREEAARQKGKEHLDRLNGKPSKDLETKFNGYKFKKIRKAGEGGFSTVWQVRGPFAAPDPVNPGSYIDIPESEQAYFAMKQVTLKKMEKISREEVLEECNLLQTLAGKRNNEDYILRFFGWKSSTGSLKILLELGEHDFNHILREGRLSRQQIKDYWQQMLEAVHFTHEEGNIVHTDLKPANFLMANGRLKLIDFGIAQKIPVGTIHIKRDAMIGTPNYMAPETVKAVKEAKKEGRDARVYKAGKASDVWALGCIFYQMVYNRPPFEAFHGDDKLKEILDPRHTIQYPQYRPAPYRGDDCDDDTETLQQTDLERVDEEMINVMHLTFIYSPSERVTIPQLLSHPFLHQRMAASHDDETVEISRGTLKEILRKIYAFTRSGELHEDDLDERGDTLFDNIRDQQ